MRNFCLIISLALIFITAGCSSSGAELPNVEIESSSGISQISTSNSEPLTPTETNTITPIPAKVTIHDYIFHEFKLLDMSQIERNDLWTYRLVHIVTSDEFVKAFENREDKIVKNSFIQKYMLPYVSVQTDGERKILIHQAGDIGALMLGPSPQELCEWTEWLYEDFSALGGQASVDLSDKERVLGPDPYRINGDMPYCPNFIKFQPTFIQSTAIASMGLRPTMASKPTESMGAPTSIADESMQTKFGSAVINQENVSELEILSWYTFGEVRDSFYLNEGDNRLGYSIVTATNLVSYSVDGNLLYELAAPIGPLYGDISSISGNHRYAGLFSSESYSVDIYDLLTGKKMTTFNHLENFPLARFSQNDRKFSNINTAAFNHEGSLLAVAYEDKTISVWDTQTGIEYSLPRTFNRAYSLEFSSDSRHLMIFANRLSVFDISTLDNMELDYFGNVPSEKFPMISRDGNYLLFMSYDYKEPPIVVDLEKRETIYDSRLIEKVTPTIQEWNEYLGMEYDQISHDRSRFFSTAKLIPVGNKFQAWSQSNDFSEIQGEYIGLRYWSGGDNYELVQISDDETDQFRNNNFWGRIASAEDGVYYCRENELVRREMPKYYSVKVLAKNCTGSGVVAYDPINNLLAYPAKKDLVEIISVETGKVIFQLRGFTKNIYKLQFSKDGNQIVLVTHLPSATPSIRNFNEVMLFSLNHDTGEVDANSLDLRSPIYENHVLNIDISQDGKFLAAGILSVDSNTPDRIHIWDFEGIYGAKVKSIPVESPDIVTISPMATMIAVTSPRSLTIKIFSLKTLELIAELQNPRDVNFDDLMFSSDGKNLFVVIGGAISIWGIP